MKRGLLLCGALLCALPHALQAQTPAPVAPVAPEVHASSGSGESWKYDVITSAGGDPILLDKVSGDSWILNTTRKEGPFWERIWPCDPTIAAPTCPDKLPNRLLPPTAP